MSQTLEDRLTSLPLKPTEAFLSRVLQSAQDRNRQRPHRRTLVVPALAAIVALVVLAGSVYAAPRFADALASAPVIGAPTSSLLRSIGLGPIDSRLTPINDVAQSSGYRIRLTGGYADGTQTLLTLHVSPAASVFAFSPGRLSLSDQFGREVELHSGTYDTRSGDQVLIFDPLPWPDQSLGARLTLRILAIETGAQLAETVPGRWTLHGQVGVQPSVRLALPTDGLIQNTSFHFTSIIRSGPVLEVDMHVSGPLASHLTDTIGQAIPNLSKPHAAFAVGLFEENGTEVQPLAGEGGSGVGYEVERTLWLVTKPGKYRLVVSFEAAGQFEREIDVP